jgi:lipopolysaccharide/colanic/teichoic acid biosynthesis glycosyltransferase
MPNERSGLLVAASERLYRLLLWIYPALFRQEYGSEMAKLFRDCCPWITRVGRWLRATYLDEMPQYFNVLKGDMSLIGPRPAQPSDVRLDDLAWQRALSVRPGITGLSQVTYGPGTVDVLRRRELDLQYVQSRSLLLDLSLLLQTFAAIVRQTRPSA